MRKISDEMKQLAESLSVEKKDEDRITQTRKYKLITPLFGGGVRPRENDSSKLIRETSVRGQLRFWWRAMRGTGTIKEMKKREDAIFGSGGENAAQSKISIVVNVTSSEKSKDLFDYSNRNEETGLKKLAYVAFPLQPDKDKRFFVTPNIQFSMNISYAKQTTYKDANNNAVTLTLQPEIEAALWAWETFGGIGGRTRRGFGALSLTEIDGKPQNALDANKIESQIKTDLERHLVAERESFSSDVPHLSLQSSYRIKSCADKNAAWHFAIERLQSFRQYRLGDVKNNYGEVMDREEDKHGKSQWSEAASIRHLILEDKKNYPKPEVEKFPRSEFGLPINFYFETPRKIKDALSRKTNNGKPEVKLTANDDDIDRLASPLILRPILCAEDKAVAIALVLNSPRKLKNGLKLNNIKSGSIKVFSTLENSENRNEAALLTTNGLAPLKNNPDVLQAFLDFFAKDDTNNQSRNTYPNNRRRNY